MVCLTRAFRSTDSIYSEGNKPMPRPPKNRTTDGTPTATTSVETARNGFTDAHKAFVKEPTAARYNAMMYAARVYQSQYAAQFTYSEPAAPTAPPTAPPTSDDTA